MSCLYLQPFLHLVLSFSLVCFLIWSWCFVNLAIFKRLFIFLWYFSLFLRQQPNICSTVLAAELKLVVFCKEVTVIN